MLTELKREEGEKINKKTSTELAYFMKPRRTVEKRNLEKIMTFTQYKFACNL